MCRRLRRMVAILFLFVGLCGCATLMTGDDATSAEKRAAICLDAQTSLAVADAALSETLEPKEKAYWEAFRTGCEIAIMAYCGE